MLNFLKSFLFHCACIISQTKPHVNNKTIWYENNTYCIKKSGIFRLFRLYFGTISRISSLSTEKQKKHVDNAFYRWYDNCIETSTLFHTK